MTTAIKHNLRALTLLTAMTIAAIPTAQAASACKGKEQSLCQSQTDCSWISGYERKDGRKVNGFCRAKPKSKSVTKVTNEASQKS